MTPPRRSQSVPTKKSQVASGDTAISGQPGGGFGAASLADRKALEDKLYDALTEIGTKRKSIHPSVLEDYDLLLECPQVSGRLNSRDRARIARVAHTALREVVSTFPDRTDQLVGEAILAVGRFEGESVDERKRLVEETEITGCSKDGYKRRRPKVLRAIVRSLLKPLPEEQNFTPDGPNRSAHVTVGEFTPDWLAHVAIGLHYHITGAGFVAAFDHHVQRYQQAHSDYTPRYPVYRPDRINVWYACSERIFSAYIDLCARTVAIVTQDPGKLADVLPEPVCVELVTLLWECACCGPLDISGITVNAFLIYLFGDWGTNVLPRPALDRELADTSPIRGRWESPFPDFYVNSWMPWYEAQLERPPDTFHRLRGHCSIRANPAPSVSKLEEMAAKSGAVYTLLNRAGSLALPFRTRARQSTLKDIVNCYALDEWLPLFDGKSIREHAALYLDRGEALLDLDRKV
ncbi:MAG: hypothetical protein JSS97_11620 [Actinobacteria bacterium]|nr:hypothetical protein [Actinomycetota bacterium]